VVLFVVVTILPIFMAMAIYASRYKRVPPNQALVVYGRRSRPGVAREGFIVLVGGGKFIVPIVETFALLSLAPFVVEVKVEDAGGAGCDLQATAKLTREPEGLRRAAQNLLDMPINEVRAVAATILEGRARGLLSRELSPRDPEFAQKLEAVTRPDYDKIGLELVGKVVVRAG
jgi:flotillin